ncbi:MAG TPA: hypothetical protein VEQ87_09815 [Burkholderiales bacterium]|nr:hypothetical protein [Burkholderiales bacterium]
MESIPEELQGVALPEADAARALALAKPTNQKVREAADARLKFEDEPARFIAFLNGR